MPLVDISSAEGGAATTGSADEEANLTEEVKNIETTVTLLITGIPEEVDLDPSSIDVSKDVIETSCAVFLYEKIDVAKDFSCKVNDLHVLQSEWVVVLQVKGIDVPSDYDETVFDQQVSDAVDNNIDEIVDDIVNVASALGFDFLSGDVQVERSEEDWEGKEDELVSDYLGNVEGKKAGGFTFTPGVIAGIAIGAVVVIALFGRFYRKKRSGDQWSEYPNGPHGDPTRVDPYAESLAQRKGGYGNTQSIQYEKSAESKLGSINEQGSYMYSLEDGLASPMSRQSQQLPTPKNPSPTNPKPSSPNQDCIGGIGSQRIIIDIFAPKGKLGIIIDTCSEGPIVHSVKPMSPLDGHIQRGDLIVGVDDEDTSTMSAHDLTRLVARKSKKERKITVARSIGPRDCSMICH